MWHHLTLEDLKVVLGDPRSTLDLLIIQRAVIHGRTHLLLIRLGRRCVALSHLQLAHLIKLRGFARLRNLKGLRGLRSALLELQFVRVAGHMLSLHLLQVVWIQLVALKEGH